MKRFLLGKAPFVRSVDEKGPSTNRIMIDLLIALTPLIIFAWVKNGIMPFIDVPGVPVITMLYPLLYVICGALSSFVLEAIYYYFAFKVHNFKELCAKVWNSYAIIPGIILALIMPLNTSIIMLLMGCLLANIIFKMLFGGFGHNVFNPALIAYVIITAAISLSMNSLNPSETIDIVSGATPLTNYGSVGNLSVETVVNPYGNLWDFFLGTVPGGLGCTSVLLCLIAYVYLVVRKVINWRVPAIYVGTTFILSLIIGLVLKQGIWFPVFHICSGGLMFGAVFMATEPVTTPKNPLGKTIFAVGCGVLTVLFRFCGAYPDGVATSILVMCLFTGPIDNFAAVISANTFTKKSVLKLTAVFALFAIIGAYSVLKVGGII